MEKYNQKIINGLNLINKIDCELRCYRLASKKYLVFENEKVCKPNLEYFLDKIINGLNFIKGWKTIIVVAETDDEFNRNDLFFFNGVNTFVDFYLINKEKNKIFMNDSWIFALGLNYRNYIRKMNKVLALNDKNII